MSDEYTPTTDEVRGVFIDHGPLTMNGGAAQNAFDRWLAAAAAEVLATSASKKQRREIDLCNWLEDHGYDPIGAGDMIRDAMQYGRNHPEIPVEEVRDAWWSDYGQSTYYPDGEN